MIERLQNYCGIAICSNKNNLKSMQGAAKAIPFHVVYKKENNWNQARCPLGTNSCCKFCKDDVKDTEIYKHGPGLPQTVVIKLKTNIRGVKS